MSFLKEMDSDYYQPLLGGVKQIIKIRSKEGELIFSLSNVFKSGGY